ncbi:MAG TPA: excinuclease ABC subunit UvrC [Candidatus Saccharimonadia bacterium]|nr:excinuclease ABC subunit UvrC [Candidatus Saccharimonadia bacterium]
MIDALRDKLKTLPAEPGVYFHRDADKKIIYIGKAAVLKNRVMSYFQKGHKDPKTRLLVADIADTEWITVGSEVEALFLESEFIKRYKPKFNIDLKDDKNFIYVKISADEFPVFTYVRRPMDDKAHYYGPFTSSDALRRAMRMLRKVFPYVTHAIWPKRGCLQYHLGLCPGPEEGAITAVEYRKSVRRLELYLRGEQTKLMGTLETDMQRAAKRRDYEAAARLRDQLSDLRSFSKQMIFGDKEAFDLSRDQALVGLAERLELTSIPRRIEAFDISHLGGVDNVASMVVFTDGAANRDDYRRFKMNLTGNDDVAHMREVITRRFGPKHLAEWPKPDLLLIDGGQPQLAAALSVLDAMGLTIPAIGLAKREEEIIRRVNADRREPNALRQASAGSVADSKLAEGMRSLDQEGHSAVAGHPPGASSTSDHYESILLPHTSHILQLLQRIRDEAHRFAITYQTILRGKRQTASLLDDIPGVGPATRKHLIRRFGSVRGVRLATADELAAAIGPAKAQILREHLGEAPAPATPPTDDMPAPPAADEGAEPTHIWHSKP